MIGCHCAVMKMATVVHFFCLYCSKTENDAGAIKFIKMFFHNQIKLLPLINLTLDHLEHGINFLFCRRIDSKIINYTYINTK
jgi:hypothetical protein